MAQGTCAIPGCTNGGKLLRGWCRSHHRRWKLYGDPLAPIRAVRTPKEILAKLRHGAFPDTDDCVILEPTTATRVVVRLNGKDMTASRAAWILAHGDPGPLHVLHRCNGGSGEHGCINTRHLYVGTRTENALDAVRAGRIAGQKLDASDVREIRSLAAHGVPIARLAAQFSVHRSNIEQILAGRRWKHVL